MLTSATHLYLARHEVVNLNCITNLYFCKSFQDFRLLCS